MDIRDFVLNPYFKNFFVTICTTCITIFVKVTTRNDSHQPFRKEDLAVGFELIITAIVLILMETTDVCIKYFKQKEMSENIVFMDKIISMPFILLFMGLFLWILSTFVRKYGWESEEKLHKIKGVILPDVCGLIMLILSVHFSKH